MDGKPAKIVILPERGQTHIYWGGVGKPDGPNHNHAVVQHSNPHNIHYLREGGKIVVDHNRDGESVTRTLGRWVLQKNIQNAKSYFSWLRRNM